MKTLKVFTDENPPIDAQKLAAAVYEQLGQKDDLAIELTFISQEEIRSLNASERGIDSVTDVLSFPYLDGVRYKAITKKDYPDDIDEEADAVFIGSVCICLDRAKEQAIEYGHTLEREINYLAAHGFLHCFGYDHMNEADEEEMTELAEKIMGRIGLKKSEVLL